MKKIIITVALLLAYSLCTFSQDISGDWNGAIDMGGQKLDFIFNISKNGTEWSARMDIPDQGLQGAKASSTTFSNNKLSIAFEAYKFGYEGTFDKDTFNGNFIQSGMNIPLHLKRGSVQLNRPQSVKPPFNYYTEDVIFPSSENLKLAGTLSLPKQKGNYPLVIIISGSGPQNRDGDMFGHQPYAVLAHHLTQNGIGVFRFDERGVGKSEGNFESASVDDLTADVIAALQFLEKRKDVNTQNLGLIGHSIGGYLAPKIASQRSDMKFLVLMAAPGLNGDELMLTQKAAIERAMGLNEMQIAQGQNLVEGAYDIITKTTLNNPTLKDSIATFYDKKYGALLPADQKEALADQLTGNEFIGLIRAQPTLYLEKVTCPVLALNGEKDLQVLPKENLNAIAIALQKNGNTKVTTQTLKNLNHLFQESETGNINEYAQIEQTMSPEAMSIISNWIKSLSK